MLVAKANKPILVSACLAGIECRYDGKAATISSISEMIKNGEAIAVCPEELGGMPTPRPPCEIVNQKIIDINGEDQSDKFHLGAKHALKIALDHGCTEAILKSSSPMCGCGEIYDGSFSGKKISGDGILTKLLKSKKFKVSSK